MLMHGCQSRETGLSMRQDGMSAGSAGRRASRRGADEGLGAAGAGRIRFTLLPADLLGLADALDAVGCLVPAGEAIRARFRGLDGHRRLWGVSLARKRRISGLIEPAHHVVAVEQIVRP